MHNKLMEDGCFIVRKYLFYYDTIFISSYLDDGLLLLGINISLLHNGVFINDIQHRVFQND